MSVLWVLAIVPLALAPHAVLWFVWLPRKTARMLAQLRADVADEGILAGPETGSYRGATRTYPFAKGIGVLGLTERRLICRRVFASAIEIPVDRFDSVRQDVLFHGAYHGGRQHVIVRTKDGAEVGFIVAEHATWMRVLGEVIAKAASR